MKEYICVFIGGGIGSMARYWVSVWLKPYLQQGFPLATFVVNLAGCFFIGLFYTLSARFNLGTETRLLLTTGLCGGFTTFSTFGYESLGLMRQGQYGMLIAYIGLSVVLGIACAWLGSIAIK